MIKKEDLEVFKIIMEENDLTKVYENVYNKVVLLLKGIALQEELNKNSDELQKLVSGEEDGK